MKSSIVNAVFASWNKTGPVKTFKLTKLCNFIFSSNLPAVDQITVNLYREPDKKKKKEKNALLGETP